VTISFGNSDKKYNLLKEYKALHKLGEGKFAKVRLY
jgi:hypothetical protein